MKKEPLYNYFVKLSESMILEATAPSEIVNQTSSDITRDKSGTLGEYRTDKNTGDKHAVLRIPTNFYSCVRTNQTNK